MSGWKEEKYKREVCKKCGKPILISRSCIKLVDDGNNGIKNKGGKIFRKFNPDHSVHRCSISYRIFNEDKQKEFETRIKDDPRWKQFFTSPVRKTVKTHYRVNADLLFYLPNLNDKIKFYKYFYRTIQNLPIKLLTDKQKEVLKEMEKCNYITLRK